VQLNVVAPAVTLSATPNPIARGQSLTLSWNSIAASQCQASGGGASGTLWSGALTSEGTLTQTVSSDGTFTYAITCLGTNGLRVRGAVAVTVTQPSGGGGGGAIDTTQLLALLGATLRVLYQRRRTLRRRGIGRPSSV
jgi:hypothetical protein